MVLVTLHFRPKNGYTYPKKIQTIEVDSYDRFDQIIQRLDSRESTNNVVIYSTDGNELPLNSSVSSHNLDEGSIIEACSSPIMSAVLTAALNDFNKIKKIPEARRNKQSLQPFLDLTEEDWNDIDGYEPNKPKWSNKQMNQRTICLAIMKKILQRDDRYYSYKPPPCHDNVNLLHNYFENSVWDKLKINAKDVDDSSLAEDIETPRTRRRSYYSLGNLFQPKKRHGTGPPTLTWVIVKKKLQNYIQVKNRSMGTYISNNNRDLDSLEMFVRMEHTNHENWKKRFSERQKSLQEAGMDSIPNDLPNYDLEHHVVRRMTPRGSNRSHNNCTQRNRDDNTQYIDVTNTISQIPRSTAESQRMRNSEPSSSQSPGVSGRRSRQRTPQRQIRSSNSIFCTSCNSAPATTCCLEDGCPFCKNLDCDNCFLMNHPPGTGRFGHERIPIGDPRVKSVIRQVKSMQYCPEYASGPFAILCGLMKAMKGIHHFQDRHDIISRHSQRELSLNEYSLKKIAQPMCRSNLYDRQQRRGSRNAFSCMDGLTDKKFVRRELIQNNNEHSQQEEKWSLLKSGEILAEYCLEFENVVRKHICDRFIRNFAPSPQDAAENKIKLIFDSREDSEYTKRLTDHCEELNIPCEKRELEAGDYLFVNNDDTGIEENVLKLVIERKTWADFADSVSGNGKSHRRLDCVRVDTGMQENNVICTRRNCQLCKMKRSGCTQIMFIIEGTRCVGTKGKSKCSRLNPCQTCNSLIERHEGLSQLKLESILTRLQVEHECYIHYTSNYNETINALINIRDILNQLSKNISQNSNAHVNKIALTYDEFSSNARNKNLSSNQSTQFSNGNGKIIEWSSNEFSQMIAEGTVEEISRSIIDTNAIGYKNYSSPKTTNMNVIPSTYMTNRKRKAATATNEVVEIDFEENSCGVKPGQKRSNHHRPQIILCDSSDNSDSSIEILETHGELKTPERIRGGGNVSDDDSDVLMLHFDPFSVDSSERNKDNQFKSTSMDKGCYKHTNSNDPDTTKTENSSSRPLVLITGSFDYAKRCMRDINRSWKDLYIKYYKKESKRINEFKDEASTQIQRMCENSDITYIHTSCFRHWSLWIQIYLGIMMRQLQDEVARENLQESWDNSSTTTVQNKNHSQVDQTKRSRSERVATRQPNRPTSEPGRSRDVASREISIDNSSNIDRPNHHTSYVPKERHPFAGGTHLSLKRMSEREMIRTARILKFDNYVNKLDWKCSICTTINESQDNFCRSCDKSCNMNNCMVSSQNKVYEKYRDSNCAKTGSNTWICDSCTYENLDVLCSCEMCGNAKKWACSNCTFANHPEMDVCEMCTEPRMLHQMPHISSPTKTTNTSRNDTVELSRNSQHKSEVTSVPIDNLRTPDRVNRNSAQKPSSKKSVSKCGACGQVGHNRSNYTIETCPAFMNPEEVARRDQKKIKAEEKAREALEAAERASAIKRNMERDQARRENDIARIMQEHQENSRNTMAILEEDAKRKAKQARAARKRAQRLSNNP